jgi:hypothetical protein
MRRLQGIILSSVGVLMLSAALLSASAGAATSSGPPLPSSDPFYSYTGAEPLGQIAPGTVLKTRPVTIVISGSSRPFSAFQVLYRTSGELGQPTVTVATVIKPLTPSVPTKLLAYQTFYDALGDQCDPSYTLQGGNPSYSDAQDDALLMENYLAAGDTVVDPDYEGENLDWTAGYESGYDTLDAIRAAEHALGVASSTPVGMVGYSGGSIATEWASELAPTYAPDLHIVGAAEGGIPVDFAHNLNYINGSPGWSGIIPGTLVALTRAFGLNLNQYLSPYGKTLAAAAAHACINTLYGAHPGLTVAKLLAPRYGNVLKIPAFVRVVDKLIMGSAPGHPEEPLFMGVGDADGTGDGVMVTKDVEALAHEYCTQGVSVNLSVYQGQSHTNAAVPFEAAALPFLQERFAGTPASSGCASIPTGDSIAPLPIPCNFAPGSLHGGVVGPVSLGETRARVSRQNANITTRGHKNEQFLCLQPTGLRLVYADPHLLSRLPRRSRAAARGRVVWISTTDTRYTLRGGRVRAGTTLAAAARLLRLGRPFKLGRNAWYFAPNGRTVAVLKVHGGVVREVGIASRVIAPRRSYELAFLRSFS